LIIAGQGGPGGDSARKFTGQRPDGATGQPGSQRKRPAGGQ
jgi:hypothetical protein